MKHAVILACLVGLAVTWGCGPAPKPAVEKKAPPPPPKTDKVFLNDGSQIICRVKGLSGGKLVVATNFAGEVGIDTKKVKGLSVGRDMNVRPATGGVVVGQLQYVDKTGQQVTEKTTGKRAIPMGQVKSLWEVGEESPEIIALRPKWSLIVEAGVDGKTGNTERLAYKGRVELHRKTPNDRFLAYLQGIQTRENGQDSEKEFLAGMKLEVDVNKAWFGWGRAEFERDKFEGISLRSTAAAGGGWFAIREAKHELKFRGGTGFRHESYRSGANDGEVVLEAAVDYMKIINDRLKFTHNTTYNPSVETARDYTLRMENAAEIPLTNKEDWKFKIGVRNDYNSIINVGVDRRLDTTYFANLVWSLE